MKRTQKHGRFSEEPNFFDFNTRPASYADATKRIEKRAVARLIAKGQRKRLAAFINAVDRANDMLGNGAREDGLAFQTALNAVVALLHATKENDNKRFSRIFELLADRAKSRPSSGSLSGPQGAGAGGVDRDSRSHDVKAATAFLIDFLNSSGGQTRSVRRHCQAAAEELTNRGFAFTGKKASPKTKKPAAKSSATLITARAKTVEHWRREFDKKGGRAGELFRKYRDKPPFPVSNSERTNCERVLTWWRARLTANFY